jgi:hypothetical protein
VRLTTKAIPPTDPAIHVFAVPKPAVPKTFQISRDEIPSDHPFQVHPRNRVNFDLNTQRVRLLLAAFGEIYRLYSKEAERLLLVNKQIT